MGYYANGSLQYDQYDHDRNNNNKDKQDMSIDEGVEGEEGKHQKIIETETSSPLMISSSLSCSTLSPYPPFIRNLNEKSDKGEDLEVVPEEGITIIEGGNGKEE